MNAVVFEHVPVDGLPQAWRDKLGSQIADAAGMRVTVRIEQEPADTAAEAFVTDDPAFGIWRDRDDLGDTQAYVRSVRTGRVNRDGSRNEP